MEVTVASANFGRGSRPPRSLRPRTPNPTRERLRANVDKEETAKALQDFSLERYKYILGQIHAVNENVYKFLAIYQALATTTVGGALTVFVGYKHWGISSAVARTGVLGLIWLETIVACFTDLLIFIGVLTWLDYRREECELTDKAVHPGFRERPKIGNFFRWYETYIMLFIAASTVFVWFGGLVVVLPAMK